MKRKVKFAIMKSHFFGDRSWEIADDMAFGFLMHRETRS